MIHSLSPLPLTLGVACLVATAVLARGFIAAFTRQDARIIRWAAPVGLVLLVIAVVSSSVSVLALPLFPLVVLSPAPVSRVARRVQRGWPFLSLAIYVVGGVCILYGSLIVLLYERTLGGSSTSRPFVALTVGAVLALVAAGNLWRIARHS